MVDAQKSLSSHEPGGPSAQTGPNGPVGAAVLPGTETPAADTIATPSTTSAVRDVLAALTAKPTRDPVTQRFIVGTLAAGGTLERSEQFWSAIEPIKRELAGRVRADLAVDDSSVETMLGLIDAYAEARLFRTSMFLRLVDQGGPITAKGKARALYTAYLGALDRETKLAQVLGLERKAKPIKSLQEVLAQHD